MIKASNQILKILITHQENMIQYIYFGKEWKRKPKGSEEIFELYQEFQENEGDRRSLVALRRKIFSSKERFPKDSHLSILFFPRKFVLYDTWFRYLEDLDRRIDFLSWMSGGRKQKMPFN